MTLESVSRKFDSYEKLLERTKAEVDTMLCSAQNDLTRLEPEVAKANNAFVHLGSRIDDLNVRVNYLDTLNFDHALDLLQPLLSQIAARPSCGNLMNDLDRMDNLGEDVRSVKTDCQSLEQKIANLRSDMEDMVKDVDFNMNVHKQNHLNLREDLKPIIDTVVSHRATIREMSEQFLSFGSTSTSLIGKLASVQKETDSLASLKKEFDAFEWRYNETSGSFVTKDSLIGVLKAVVPDLLSSALSNATATITTTITTTVMSQVLQMLSSRLEAVMDAVMSKVSSMIADQVSGFVPQASASELVDARISRPVFLPDPFASEPVVDAASKDKASEQPNRFKLAPVSQRGMASGSSKPARPHSLHRQGQRSISRPVLPAASRGKKSKE